MQNLTKEIQSLLKTKETQDFLKVARGFIELIEKTNPTDIGPEIPIRPIYRPDNGQASALRDSKLAPTGESPLNRDTMVAADD